MRSWFFSAASLRIVAQVQSSRKRVSGVRRSQRSPRSSESLRFGPLPQSNPPVSPFPKGIASSHRSIGAASSRFDAAAGPAIVSGSSASRATALEELAQIKKGPKGTPPGRGPRRAATPARGRRDQQQKDRPQLENPSGPEEKAHDESSSSACAVL